MPYERGSPQRTHTRTRTRTDAQQLERNSTPAVSAQTETAEGRRAARRPPSEKQTVQAEPIFTPTKDQSKQRAPDATEKEGDRPHSLFHQPEAAGERHEASANQSEEGKEHVKDESPHPPTGQ